MKWLVLGGKDQEVRFKALSEFLTAHGTENQVEFSFPETNDFLMVLERLIKTVDQIRLQSPYGDRARDFQNRSSDLVNLLGSADSIVKRENGDWWPENILYEAFLEEFIKNVRQADLMSHALIVGSGAAAKVTIAALSNLGFSRFILTDRFSEKANATIDLMKRKFFGITFEYVPPSNLMLLPGSSSVLVNATPLVVDNAVLKDLYYFNFLKMPATIIDLNIIPPEPPLVEEGKRIGAQVLSGYEIAAKADVLWSKKCLGISLNFEDYKKFLKEKLSQIPFDPSPYRHA